MGSLRTRVESWIKEQTSRVGISWPPPLPQQWRWPPWKGQRDRKDQEKALREALEQQRRQLSDLCRAVKAETIADLQEILCSMVLSECVYKSPASDMLWYINKFKSDFGGQVVSLERVQPSLDHVPHRYLLAEAGDTIYASFIGTKQYKDVIADVNILQGAIFHEDDVVDYLSDIESEQADREKKIDVNLGKPIQAKWKQLRERPKPAAHRGFLGRAKGIPALELYKLAQKKNRKLVLCGHSLGGAVAVLSTLAILRILASSSLAKEHEKVPVKCITFSQPPVGNAALRDYVHQKGWQSYFKTYCIPEDLVPRILSPAYFHHYNTQVQQSSLHEDSDGSNYEGETSWSTFQKGKINDGEELVLGVGPVQTSIWRLKNLVPLAAVQKHLNVFKKAGNENGSVSSLENCSSLPTFGITDPEPESLEIQEDLDGISLTPLDPDRTVANDSHVTRKNSVKVGESRRWHRVPSLPSYVPFGQLYLLGSSSVESLSDAEYSKLTSAFAGMEQLPQFPHPHQLLGLAAPGAVEFGHIVEPPRIQIATSILPLGWTGIPGDKHTQPMRVDIVGHGLHHCTLVQAQVNGSWYSTTVETLPSMLLCSTNDGIHPQTQEMRILISRPLKHPPKFSVVNHSLRFNSIAEHTSSDPDYEIGSLFEDRNTCSDGLNNFVLYCTSDFFTVSKEVHVRTRRVRLLGLEGAGKTSLFRALLDLSRQRNRANLDIVYSDMDVHKVVEGGVCYLDSVGISLQELQKEVFSFGKELEGVCDLSRKTDLIVLVHNLSSTVPRWHDTETSFPAMSLLLNEVKVCGIPWVLAITNKFSVSAHQQNMLINSAIEAYQAPRDMTVVVNSCPFITPTYSGLQSLHSIDDDLDMEANRKVKWIPVKLARISFRKRSAVMPVEGISEFRRLIHCVLASNEEMAFQELTKERLSLELAREQEKSIHAMKGSQEKETGATAAAIGASLGAGLGLVMAVVMGAASALRKP